MTDDEKAELADVYEKAAEYLEEYGWMQHEMGDNGGPRCLAGAIESVSGSNESRYLAFIGDVLELDGCGLSSCNGRCGGPAVKWNDALYRTKDEVINTLHALANKLR